TMIETGKQPSKAADKGKMMLIVNERVKFTTEATVIEINAPNGRYYTKVINDGIDMETITCFGLEAHTFGPDCNEVVNAAANKDKRDVPNALKQVKNTTDDIEVRNSATLRDLISDIEDVDLNIEEDSCMWALTSDDSFSVGDTRCLIDAKLLPSSTTPTSWDKALPRKVNIFLWRVALDGLPNRLNLLSRVKLIGLGFGFEFRFRFEFRYAFN
nr:RNA-directed DNA polymerase, eukaryota, reverse transcriptase zinc-binding domain protein [Tanacetum cinerariifolium]